MKLPGLSRSGGLSHVCFFFILFMLSCKFKSFLNSGHSTKPETTCCNSCEIMERPRAFFCWENWRLPAAEEPWRVAKSTALYPFYLYTPLMHTCGMFPVFVFGIHVSLSTLQSSKLSILLTMMKIMKLMTRMNRIIIIIIIIIIITDHPYKPGRPWRKNLQPLENKFKGFTPTNPWKKNLIPWKRNLSTERLPPRCIRKTCYVIRSQFIEFWDQRTKALHDHRTREPQDQRTRGPQDQRTTGPEDHRTRGPNNQRTRGPKDQTARGPQGQRSLNFFSRGCKYFFQGTWIFFPGNVNFFSSIIPMAW